MSEVQNAEPICPYCGYIFVVMPSRKRKSGRSGMLFMPDISIVKYGNDNRITSAFPSSDTEMSGNDKTVA